MMKEKEYIWGKNPAVEVIRKGKRHIYRIMVQDTRFSDYVKLLGKTPVRMEKVNRNRLSSTIGRKDHQGIVVETDSFPYTDFATIRDRSPELILMTEGVTDPQNLGAIVRSAFLLGVGGLLIESKFSASITPVVTHTSAGATEGLPIAVVESVHHTIHELKQLGYLVLATDMPGEDTVDIRQIQSDKPIVFILGSEGHGLRRSTLKLADKLISIPQAENPESFSDSAAASIVTFVLASMKKKI